ncbi:MAG: hypothetical protein JSS07_10165 [Proteobacteria bacterium]|nr:hypothetical protein [Pseudomonadota bacterium]
MFNKNVLGKIAVISVAFFFMIANQLLSAKSMSEPLEPDEPINIPILVLDEETGSKIPKRFRTSLGDFKETQEAQPSKQGLDKLQIAGSAQFSKETLEEALKALKGPVWIIDLRKESHGFVNGLPISWYSAKNQSNVEESDDNIQRQESMLFSDIKRQGAILVSEILEKRRGIITKTRPIDLKVESTNTEFSLMNKLNLGYIRIGVLDHHRPSDNAVDTFIDFTQKLPPEGWLYFHCRGGAGRTTTFMIMYDILKNGKKVSLNDIVQRQYLLGGSKVFDPSDDPNDAWKRAAAIERKQFIEKFYKFVNDPKGYQHQTWSQWAAFH